MQVLSRSQIALLHLGIEQRHYVILYVYIPLSSNSYQEKTALHSFPSLESHRCTTSKANKQNYHALKKNKNPKWNLRQYESLELTLSKLCAFLILIATACNSSLLWFHRSELTFKDLLSMCGNICTSNSIGRYWKTTRFVLSFIILRSWTALPFARVRWLTLGDGWVSSGRPGGMSGTCLDSETGLFLPSYVTTLIWHNTDWAAMQGRLLADFHCRPIDRVSLFLLGVNLLDFITDELAQSRWILFIF